MPDGASGGAELGPRPPHLRDVPLRELIDAKIHTAEFLAAYGIAPSDAEIEAEAARNTFAVLTDVDTSDEDKRLSLNLLETPESVRHLVAMLTAYDYDMINHATEIRAYLTTRVLEDVEHPDPRIRLKAIELAGKIAGVGLFEEKISIKRTDLTDEELDTKIKERMARLRALEAPSSEPVDVEFTETPTATPSTPSESP